MSKEKFEIYCYETEKGEICIEFGEAGVKFSKKRFLEFADKLNEVRQSVLKEYLNQKTNKSQLSLRSYRI